MKFISKHLDAAAGQVTQVQGHRQVALKFCVLSDVCTVGDIQGYNCDIPLVGSIQDKCSVYSGHIFVRFNDLEDVFT